MDCAMSRADALILRNEQTRLVVDPRVGGSLHELKWRDWDLLRPTPVDQSDDPFNTACFAMIPYANRVARGRFDFGGYSVRLARNWSEDPHPIHGQGWRRAWDLTQQSETSATLVLEGGGNEWPWCYRGTQRFSLLPDGVVIELSIQNLSPSPMPAMLGLHPYFPDAENARVEAALPRMWVTDGEALPLYEVVTPIAPTSVRAISLDRCFSGWDGTAQLSWPDHTVTLRATNCKYLHVYTPPGRGFFCLEPQTAAPGALSRNEATILAPDEQLSIRVQLTGGAL
jgi:aldose 1-epimerase